MIYSIKRWFSIQMVKHAHLMILLGIVIFNVVLWLAASLAAFLVDRTDFANYGEALAWCVAWLLDPGTYNYSTPFAIRLVSVIVIITAMVTFSGGIIAYVANLFSTIVEDSKKGKGRLYLKDHIVILNWSSEAPEIICDFSCRDEKEDIVVLSSNDRDTIEKQVKNKAFEQKRNLRNCNLIARTGSVFSEATLDSVGIKDAKTIIILRDESQKGISDEDADIISLKAMMMALSEIKRPEQTVIIEVARKETADLIRADRTRTGQVIPIIARELMGHLIAQTILVPDINNVYSELFSYEGAEFYEIPHIEEKKAIEIYNSIVPMEENGHSFALSEGVKNLRRIRKGKLPAPRLLHMKKPLEGESRNVIVFGKSTKRPYIEESIRHFSLDCGEKTDIRFIAETTPQLIYEMIEKTPAVKTIVILSDDSLPEDHLDSNVLFTLLLIKDITKERKITVIVEILNQLHQEISKRYNVDNIIVSTTYVSHMITQISENRALFPLFEDLLTYDEEKDVSYEIYTYEAGELFAEPLPLRFGARSEFINSVYVSSKERMIPIGFIHEDRFQLFKGNLDKEGLMLEKGDRIIAIDR